MLPKRVLNSKNWPPEMASAPAMLVAGASWHHMSGLELRVYRGGVYLEVHGTC